MVVVVDVVVVVMRLRVSFVKVRSPPVRRGSPTVNSEGFRVGIRAQLVAATRPS